MSRPNGVHVYYFPSQPTHALFGKTIASFITFLTLTVNCETRLGIFKYSMFLTVYSIYQRQYEKKHKWLLQTMYYWCKIVLTMRTLTTIFS